MKNTGVDFINSCEEISEAGENLLQNKLRNNQKGHFFPMIAGGNRNYTKRNDLVSFSNALNPAYLVRRGFRRLYNRWALV